LSKIRRYSLYMTQFIKYRTLLLALVFALFNVGLPIVLDTCPMAKMGASGMCAACHPDSRAETETIGLPASSCCTVVVVGDRNTNEFEQSRDRAIETARTLIAAVPENNSSLSPVQFTPALAGIPAESPPEQPDIRIFTSSLLI
jgi:hypothetical protein